MKRFKSFFYKYGGFFCMAVMFVAIHTANITCIAKFHQPEEPAELARFKKA